MPWYQNILPIPEPVKKKCYVYLIQRYLGQYFEEKLDPSQLTVDLYNGTCVLKDIRLDVQALNELADKQNWPLEIVDGSIEKLYICVPWSSLLKESSSIEVTSLRITMQPKQRNESATSMFESMWTSMTSSLHLAEECAKEGAANSPNSSQTYEGLEIFAQTIDSILSRIRVKFVNSVFQLEHLPKGSPMGVGLVINIDLITYSDESCNDPSKEEATDLSKQDDKRAYLEQSYTARSTRLEGISVSTIEFSSKARTVSQSVMLDSSYYEREDVFTTLMNKSNPSENANLSEGNKQEDSSDERHIIMFGKFSNKVEVIVRLKRTENLEGPKVSIEMEMGSLLLFLSPRQLHLLIELVSGLASPDTEDHSNVLKTKYAGKPMSSTDYEKIEKDLQQQLIMPNFQLHGLVGRGWASGALDSSDIDENFLPLRGHGVGSGLYDSTMSGDSTMESSLTSSITSFCTDMSNRTHKKLNKIDTDPTAEISRFEIHLATLAIILLHEDLLTESLSEKCNLVTSSVKQMQTNVANFFSQTASIFITKDFKNINSTLDGACQLNHIRLLASPLHLEGDEKTTITAFSISGYLESTKLELSECLYQSNDGNIEHISLLTFTDYENTLTAKPSLKLIFKHLEKNLKSGSNKGGSKTELLFSLHRCTADLDITIIDRISAILNPQPICVVGKGINPWGKIPISNDNDSSKNEIKITSPGLTVKLHFPKPDFRPPHDMNKTPWWKRHVRPDFLSLILTNMSFQTVLQSNQNVQEYSVHCKNLNVSYHEDANSPPIPIGKAGYEDKALSSMQDVLATCKLNIKIFPSKRRILDESSQILPEPMSTSIAAGLMENQNCVGPFSGKRIIHESDTPHQHSQTVGSKELLVPGEKSEINNFIKTAIMSAKIQIDVALPTVSMQLISKHLYEIIYNRINNDLLLWEPSAPKPKTNNYDNLNYGTFGNIDIEGQEVFTLCKSGIQFDSESESEEENESGTNIFYSTYGSRMKVSQKQLINESKEESYLTLNLHIGKGLLCMFAPVRDISTNNVIPGQQGEFLINVEDSVVFMVNGYMGDSNLGYVCLELHNAHLHHCDMISTPSHSPPLKDMDTMPSKHLHPTIYSSENGMLANCKARGGNREMVTLCVKIQASHETHHVKNVSVAVGFNKVTLRHRMCNEPNSWISQLLDFFNVKDYPIPGYHAKEILTELFVHFWDSAIDYRPRYLPLRAAITLGNFSISSHLSAEVDSSTLRFIAEECGLFLSQKGINKNILPYVGPVDLKKDYVNVIDLGLFEISLKTSDKKNLDTPHFDLRASNNIIHIRTCSDSAKALTQLIQYFANDGDLMAPEMEVAATGSNFSSPRHQPEQELVSVEPQEVANLSASQHQQIHDLLQDALEDVEENNASQPKSDFYTYNGTKMFYFPDEKSPIVAESIKPLPQVTSELGQTPFQPPSNDFDDDFCFIDEEPGFNIFPKNGIPEIKWLADDPVRIVENHFAVPSEKCDPLKTPKNYPIPSMRYTLCEMSVVWHMYGGNDFGIVDKEKKKSVNFADQKLKDTVMFANSKVVIETEKKHKSWLSRGGPNRDRGVLMELQLNKIRFQHEIYPETASKASRQVLIVSEVEMRDRLKTSQMNKFLYPYTSQNRPKQSNANMIVIKTLHIRPDPQLRSQECGLKISLLPLRFNIDQDALQFLITFFTELGGDSKDGADDILSSNSKHNTPVHQPPVMTVNEDDTRLREQAKKIVDDNLLILLEENKNDESNILAEESPQLSNSVTSEDSPVYFRKVVFSPDVPIKLDYHGKHFDLTTHGPLQGLLLGLAQLNCSELRLKRISHRHGILGFEKLMMFLIKEWINDIKKNQIPSLLIGVGPMYSFVQLFQGIKDLFCLPFEQYKKDGRFFRGLHRGANSFTTSTAMAALELTTRLIHLIQITAETAFDMLTPGPSVKINPKTKGRRKRYSQPKDILEGMTNAYKLVKEGIEETADNILQVASHEHEQKGYSGAVGGVIRQIPPTIIKPIIIASEATNNVLGGMRCQLVPDARKEANEKWRSEDTYDSYL